MRECDCMDFDCRVCMNECCRKCNGENTELIEIDAVPYIWCRDCQDY